MEMARQRPGAAGQTGQSDKRRQDALQRLPVFLDRRIPAIRVSSCWRGRL
jgi:hypothetical protein